MATYQEFVLSDSAKRVELRYIDDSTGTEVSETRDYGSRGVTDLELALLGRPSVHASGRRIERLAS